MSKKPTESEAEQSWSEAGQGDAGGVQSQVAADLTPDQLREELESAREKQLRAQAEFENFRKRTQRELHDQLRFANQALMVDLLPVLDNVKRAIDAASQGQGSAGLVEGFRMVGRQLQDVLARHHCERIVADGQPFDPHLHQAVAQRPSADFPPGTVLETYQDGYQLYDRVIRPAQVVVSAAAEGA
jgi:molecular chaperone GrpE